MNIKLVANRLSLAVLFFGAATMTQAQDYPSRVIKILPPTAAGSAPDTVARILAAKLTQQLGQSVIVENKPGANSIVPSDAVAKSAPDGYTLLLNTGSQAINPSVYKKLPYDTLKDFAPVALIGTSGTLVMVVSPGFKANTLAEFLALAKEPKSDLSFGSAGVGNTLHLAGEYFNMNLGTQLLHVPYKGGAPAMAAVMGGEVSVAFLNPVQAVSQVRSGKLRALAVTGKSRMPQLPNVPTIAESGFPNFDFDGGWFALYAASKTPKNIIARLNQEVNIAIADPSINKQLNELGISPVISTPEDLERYLKAEITKFAKIVRAAKIEPE